MHCRIMKIQKEKKLMIAEKIKKYRKDRDMTQETLAQVLGVLSQSIL